MMFMKKIFMLAAACMTLFSCGKETPEGKNDDNKREFDAWIQENHPGIEPTALGSYILEETPGTGAPAADSAYLRVEVTSRYLDGTVYTTTSEQVARQVGSYFSAPTAYFGPVIWYRSGNSLYAGLEELVSGMNVGGSMTAVIPGWLNTFKRYSSAAGYLKNVNGTNLIYSFKIVEAFNDAEAWELDSLSRYMQAAYPEVKQDTTLAGFWFVPLEEGDESVDMDSASGLYINYTGRRLDGKVFDTTIKDTATVAGLVKSSSSFGRKSIGWNSDYSKITMGGSTVVDGFAYGISKLRPGGKALCFFYSGLGYKNTGSGSAIPAFCPLCFELEMTQNE